MSKQFYLSRKGLLILLAALIVTTGKLTGQVNITGPVCVIPGITYQYRIQGNWDSVSTVRICIIGGTLRDGQTCTPDGATLSSVFVKWSDGGIHKLNITSSSGNFTLTVNQAGVLTSGAIYESDKEQVYDSTIANYTFRCTDPGGGACAPNYIYQWQKSINGNSWVNITGSTGKDLLFSGSITVNTFFRRVTTETKSNTVTYSDWGTLSIPVN